MSSIFSLKNKQLNVQETKQKLNQTSLGRGYESQDDQEDLFKSRIKQIGTLGKISSLTLALSSVDIFISYSFWHLEEILCEIVTRGVYKDLICGFVPIEPYVCIWSRWYHFYNIISYHNHLFPRFGWAWRPMIVSATLGNPANTPSVKKSPLRKTQPSRCSSQLCLRRSSNCRPRYSWRHFHLSKETRSYTNSE